MILQKLDALRENLVIAHDSISQRWLLFHSPLKIFETYNASEVLASLRAVEDAVAQQGLYAAGFLAYEAATGFDPALSVKKTDSEFPLMWFGLYERPRFIEALSSFMGPACAMSWHSSVTPHEYQQAFKRIKEYICSGDTYQVNYTLRLHASFCADPWSLFIQLLAAHKPAYGAFICTDDWIILSASPELFFQLQDDCIESRPMKGTAARGRTFEEDMAQVEALRFSEKERAENVMIVDMVRNDIGRIAVTGSVNVRDLFVVERYPTILQMISTVRGRTHASVTDILQATFPASSITGAPKRRTMEIIAELESAPRRIYTGSMGFIAPGRRAQFNVAIRTVLVSRKSHQAEYGVGGGIVWDSELDAEQSECNVKSRILDAPHPMFSLLETILWVPEEGYCLLDRHLERLKKSAWYFDCLVDIDSVREDLASLAQRLPLKAHRIRLLVDKDGQCRCEAEAIKNLETGSPKSVAFARSPVNSSDVFLYHKTTNRRVYEQAIAGCPGYDDVLLYNEKGEVTESTIANIVMETNGVLWTPPVQCGLLPGTYRAELLEQGMIQERAFTIDEVLRSPRVYLINSVRGMYEVSVH